MTTTARTTPSGNHLEDGFVSKIAFAADADVSLWEISVTPPGIEGGDPIDITTMFNTTYVTKEAGQLLDVTDAGMECAYDPLCYDQIIALINQTGWVTVHYSNADTIDFIGYLRSFVPGAMTRNEMPVATCVIVATNTLAYSETAPDYTAGGTP